MTVEHLSLTGRRVGRSEGGQDTTECVLVIILLVFAFIVGMMVWSKSVNGAHGEAEDCSAAEMSTGDDASRRTPPAREIGAGYGYGSGNGNGYGGGRSGSGGSRGGRNGRCRLGG